MADAVHKADDAAIQPDPNWALASSLIVLSNVDPTRQEHPHLAASVRQRLLDSQWNERRGISRDNPFYGGPGIDEVVDFHGRRHEWRRELTQLLLADQQRDGSWVNPERSPDTREADPLIATSYALMTLRRISGGTKNRPADGIRL